jgi:sugar lactone lactonase YvrE
MKQFVRPAPGLLVPMPIGVDGVIADLPPDGMEVDMSDLYWMRRIADGDVTVVAPSKTTPKKGEA